MDTQTLLIVGFAFALGGIIKGATGAGAPLIAVPVMSSFVDVRFAVAVFVLPNLFTNLIQAIIYRRELTQRWFLIILCLSGGVGAFAGSLMLYQASSMLLEKLLAFVVLAYIGFRVLKPGWQLSIPIAQKLSAPVGFMAGLLQGLFGISAPASLPFLNAIKFPRKEFIVIVSCLFTTMSVVQLPTLVQLDLLTYEHLYLGGLAILPLVSCMPIGGFLLRQASPKVFDKLILLVLFCVALRLLLPH